MTLVDDRVEAPRLRHGIPPGAKVPASVAALRLEAATVFSVALVAYLTLGALIVFGLDALPTDSLARVANASAAVASRDPHLGGIGFVWSPLPNVALIPLVALHDIAGSLRSVGFAASISSAVLMAATVGSLRKTLAAFGVSALPRLVTTALFAASPMIVLYGANGMSEAFLLLPLVTATRHLWLWLGNQCPQHLVWVGSSLGVAYLCRYEALAAGISTIAVVLLVTVVRHRGTQAERWGTASVDAAIVAFPVAAAFVGWAAVSWIIIGHPFDQFSSDYGNSAQVAASAKGIEAATGFSGDYLLDQVTALAPTIALAATLALAAAVVTRRLRPLAPLVVVGPVCVSQGLLFVRHTSFGWLRFQIAASLLLALLVVTVLAELRWRPRWQLRWRPALAATAAAMVLLGPAMPLGFAAMRDPVLAREEANLVAAIAGDGIEDPRALPARSRYAFEREIARQIDRMLLPEGAILADSALAFPIVLASQRIDQWVITPDRDFKAALASPAVFSVEYLLTPIGQGGFDAVAGEYPDLATTPEVATPAREFHDQATGRRWRLYRVTPLPFRSSGGQLPRDRRDGTVRAKGSGPDRAVQVPAQRGVELLDLRDGRADRPGDVDPGPLSGVSQKPRPAVAPQR